MNFQTRRGEDDVNARFGQALGPMNVGFFIKARLQFHYHGDFFTVMRGMDHRVDDARVFRHTVDVDLYRQHARVERRLAQQFKNVLKGVIRVIQQHIALADCIKSVTEFLIVEPDVAQTRQRFIHQVGFANVGEVNKVFEVMVTAAGNNRVVARNRQFFT